LYYHDVIVHSLVRIFSSLCLLLAIGCTSYHPVEIAVSNASGIPVAGASVHVAPMYLFNPTPNEYLFVIDAYEIIYPFPSKGDAGLTDEDGYVTLKIADENPLSLSVYAEGYAHWQGQIALTKQDEIQIEENVSNSDLVVRER